MLAVPIKPTVQTRMDNGIFRDWIDCLFLGQVGRFRNTQLGMAISVTTMFIMATSELEEQDFAWRNLVSSNLMHLSIFSN